jgi:hypothetical protein
MIIVLVFAAPAHAFTANSLDITVDTSGDATAVFRFTLEGLLENAIPQQMLEEELTKGLTTSAEPPAILSFDRSSATILMKQFAQKYDVPEGTAYQTTSMDFTKAQAALENSALSSVVSADFSPAKIIVIFPDGYKREFNNIDALPALSHTVLDPSKRTISYNGAINVTSAPAGVKVSVDTTYLGDAPGIFPDILPGTHTLLFAKEGYEPVSKVVIITPGKTTNVAVFLKYKAPNSTANPYRVPGFGWAVASFAIVLGILFSKRLTFTKAQ